MTLTARSPLGNAFDTATPVANLSRQELDVMERVDFGCILCTSAVDAGEVLERLTDAAGIQIPAASGPVSQHEERLAIWVSPRSWLILCSLDDELDLVASINTVFSDRLVLASPFTDGLGWFELTGKNAEDVLRQGGFISLDARGLKEGHVKRTLIAGIPVFLHRKSTNAWTVAVERSRVSFFTGWLHAIVAERDRICHD